MPVPTQLFRRPGFAVYAPQREEATTQPGADANLAGSLDGYFRQPTMTEPEPAAEITTEPEAELAPETTTEPAPEDEPAAPAMATKREPVTPTAPGQGDFYRTGETPTSPEPPAKPSSPASDEKSSYSGGGGGGDKQVDDDGEPVDGLSPKAIDNILKEHNAFRAQEGERPLT
jgi:hypothetical protein